MYDSVVCPACGQRARVRDPNHFEPFGMWEGQPVVTCRVCGSGLKVRPGLRGPRAAVISPSLWLSLQQVRQLSLHAPHAPRADAAPGEGTSATTLTQDLQASAHGLEAVQGKIRSALNVLKTLQVDRHDPRAIAVHHELASALVLINDLVLEAKDTVKESGEPKPNAEQAPKP